MAEQIRFDWGLEASEALASESTDETLKPKASGQPVSLKAESPGKKRKKPSPYKSLLHPTDEGLKAISKHGSKGDSEEDKPYFTVSEISQHIQALFQSDSVLGQTLVVRGELSNVKPSSRGHLYFSLKDDGAALNGVMWASVSQKLAFSPESGLEVFITGKLDTYAPNGSYSIVAKKMEPVGVGALQLAYLQTKEKLAAEGLFDEDRKRPLPEFPCKIAIITSENGAVIHDMMRVIRRKNPMVDILLAPVPVQGDGAATEIAETLNQLNAHQSRLHLDLIILARGGGSFEDLFCFSEEAVVRAVAESIIPVVTGIGHEPDYSLADAAADYSASTPTAAAEKAVPDFDILLGEWLYRKTTLLQQADHLWSRFELDLDRRSDQLRDRSQQQLEYWAQSLARRRQALAQFGHQLIVTPQTQLQSQAAQLDSYSPLSTLARGYAVVTNANSALISSQKQVAAGEWVKVQLNDGALEAEIKRRLEK